MKKGEESKAEVQAILELWLERAGKSPSEDLTHFEPAGFASDDESDDSPSDLTSGEAGGRYDFDLAEFPLFSLYKNRLAARGREPLHYTDTIRGRDGEPVVRTWNAYPGAFGFGGATTQLLLYDLLQMY